MKTYTSEEIDYMLDVARDTLTIKFRNGVCKALSILDKKIVDKIINRVLFISSDFIKESSTCHLILNSYAKHKVIIFLSENLLKKSETGLTKAILHEVAHFYLKHKQCFDLNEIEIKKQENEADNLANKWLNKK